MSPRKRDLLGLAGMPAELVRELLRDARAVQTGKATQPLVGKTVATLFFEDSTRTRSSFTLAAQKLGASVIDCSGASTSVSKGETLIDTARTIESMGVDAIITRTKQAGAPAQIARKVRCPVINAGDGRHQHPTQGLLDALTLAEAVGRGESLDLKGLRVGIVGDVANSRVARSDVAVLNTLGADTVLIGPPGLVPPSLQALGASVSNNFDDELGTLDAVIMLRVQFERAAGGAFVSRRAYREGFTMSVERAARLKDDAVVMHPGPFNRGLEIDGEVADAEGGVSGVRSLIRDQVRTGVAVRMAVLNWAIGTGTPAGSGTLAGASA